MKITKALRFDSIRYQHGGPVFPSSLFTEDTTNKLTEEHLIRERRQTVGGRDFTVVSFYDRHAAKSARDQYIALMEIDAEKVAQDQTDCR